MKTKDDPTRKKRYTLILFAIVSWVSVNTPAYSQSGFPYAYGDQVLYYPKLSGKTQNMEAIKSGLSQSLKKVGQVYDAATQKTIDAKDIRNISVLDDRIEIETKGKRNSFTWLFSAIDDSTMLFFGKRNAGNYVFLPSVANFAFAEQDAAQQFADNIYAVQYPRISQIRDSLLAVFKTKLQAFKDSKREAPVKDEQKALLLAADTASQRMDYFEAIRIYIRAIEIDEIAYPRAYSNIALLYAHINFFDYAIYYMQKYICLETDAGALRGAKDKMAEWEELIYY